MPTIGTCSKCKGPVQAPEFWGGNVPPVPTCAHCGAQPEEPYGPTIKMGPRTPFRTDAVGTDRCKVTIETTILATPRKYEPPKHYGLITWTHDPAP